MGNFSIDSSRFDKPNRISTPENEKQTAEYHVKQAKFYVATDSQTLRSSFLRKTAINKSFYKGGDSQWIFEEDTEEFLKDDTNQERNRIKVVNNVVKPLVLQYKGNANRLDLNATAEVISETAKNRMTEALKERLHLYNESIGASPAFKDVMKKEFGVGDTKEETEEIFINEYVDEFADSGNKLINFCERINRLDQYKIKLAEELSLSGIGVTYGSEKRGHLKFEVIESEDFIFDHSARRYDLADGDFQGVVQTTTPTSIFEAYNLKRDDAEAIENYVNNIGNVTNQVSRNDNVYSSYYRGNLSGLQVQVFKVYFKDVQKEDWGYVYNEYGYKHLVKINFVHPGETEPKYTEADLVEPPETHKNKRLFKGKMMINTYNEILRFCYFIPSEIIASVEPDAEKKKTIKDIVLDYGVHYFQGATLEDPSEVKFPFNVFTWGYVDGEIMSPVDDAISPQRFINRILSVTESNINNSGGSSVVIDEDALNPDEVQDGTINRNIKQGKPVLVRSKGRGVPNMIGHYDNTPKDGVYKMFDIIPVMKDVIQSTTGVNEPLQGGAQQGGGTQLVGTTELLIQRGSLMQEPFYKAIEEIYIQMYEMMVTDGKMLYVQNERVLSNITGDKGVEVFKMSKDMLNEDLRVFIKRENSDEMLKNQANQMLQVFFEQQMIDQKVFSNLYNRSTPAEVTAALRKYTAAKIEAEKMAAKRAEEQANMAAIEQDADLAMAKEEQLEAEKRDLANFAAQEKIKAGNKENEMITKGVIDNQGE